MLGNFPNAYIWGPTKREKHVIILEFALYVIVGLLWDYVIYIRNGKRTIIFWENSIDAHYTRETTKNALFV